MRLSEEAKAARSRQRMLAKAKEYTTGTYVNKFVAPLFQRMVRAEFGADPRQYVSAVVFGEIHQVPRAVGQCACITCGKIGAWDSGIEGMHTGHFLASRRNSILLEEDNCAPQCAKCNYYRGGEQNLFRKWMIAVRGQEIIDRLERLKTQVRQFTREELVDLRIGYQKRLAAAVEKMST